MSGNTNPLYLVIGPLAGVVVGYLIHEVQSWLRRRSRRRSLAAALLTEMTDQAQWIVSYGNNWNCVVKKKWRVSCKAAFTGRPKPSIVYPNVVAEVPNLFDAPLTARIVQFHGYVEQISTTLDSWYEANHELTQNDPLRIAILYRKACSAAADSIRQLKVHAQITPVGEEAINLYQKVMELLSRVGNGEYIDVSDEPILAPITPTADWGKQDPPQ